MKILVVSQYYYPEPFRVTDICETLAQRGHQVTVLTGLPNYPEGKILKEYKSKEHRDEMRNGVRIIRCYEHGRGNNAIHLLWNYFSFAISGKKMVRKLDKDFDVVLINQLSPVMMAWPGIKYAKKYGKKTFLYCYDLWPASLAAGGIKQGSFIYKIFDRISKKVYRQVDKIAVTSKSFIEYFIKEHGIEENKLFYLPQYCEGLFSDIKPRVNDGTYNYVFAGNIGAMQSVETIIKAAMLVKDDPTIKIHIVGDGRDLENCKKEAEGLGNVIFYGRRPVEEMPKFYEMADAMLVTLAKDDLVSKTLPGKVQSYMAAGKPIIASIVGEAKLVIEEAECGMICEAEDYEELAKLFVEFKHMDSENFSNNAKKYYELNFVKSKFFDGIVDVLKSGE